MEMQFDTTQEIEAKLPGPMRDAKSEAKRTNQAQFIIYDGCYFVAEVAAINPNEHTIATVYPSGKVYTGKHIS